MKRKCDNCGKLKETIQFTDQMPNVYRYLNYRDMYIHDGNYCESCLQDLKAYHESKKTRCQTIMEEYICDENDGKIISLEFYRDFRFPAGYAIISNGRYPIEVNIKNLEWRYCDDPGWHKLMLKIDGNEK